MSEHPSAVYRGTSPAGQHWVLELIHDQDIESPRVSQENLGVLIYAHRRYTLGDERITQGSMTDYLADKGLSSDKMVSLPVYLLDHSGLALSTKDFGDPWDSGCVGAIYATFDEIDSQYGDHTEETLDQVRDSLRAEIAEMDAYLSGDAYGFRLYQAQGAADSDEEDTPLAGDEPDSCWGFLGADPRTNGMSSHFTPEAALALAPALAAAHGRLPDAPEPPAPSSAARAPRPR